MIRFDKDPTLAAYLKQSGLKSLGFDPGEPDNWWGPKSEAAYQNCLASITAQEEHTGFSVAIASVFADEKDLRNFTKCKAQGHSDLHCFGPPLYGDNGIGASGRATSQMVDPMVALHALTIRAKWGEMSKAWGKAVVVQYGEKECTATLEDYMSSPHAEIDLNPAAVQALGIPDGAMVKIRWKWA